MNIKINTICFIILLFLLIGVASAAEMDNETLQQTIEQPDDNVCQTIPDNQGSITASSGNIEKLEASVNKEKLEASNKNKKESVGIITKSTKSNVKIKAPDVKMHYKDGTKFTVTLKNEANKAMKKSKVKITIDGKTYTKTTNSKGKASIDLNFKSGKYTVTTTFDETKTHCKRIVKSTVTIKSTIKANDFSKYYKNKASYFAKFYDKKGKLLKSTSVKFKLNGKSHSVKTNKKGIAKLAIDLKPGTYSISSVNSKTSETITKTITIISILETRDLTMNEKDGSKFTVKVLNSNGKVSPNKKVTLNVNGITYTPKSNSNGIATQVIDLPAGKYSITTEYEGLKNTNQITVNKVVTQDPIRKSEFSHLTIVPNYVNVTMPYVFHNSAYSLETGFDGIIRMSKNEVYTVQISETKGYLFSQASIPGVDTTVIGYKTHLVPFDGSGIQSDFNRDNLKGDGILISTGTNYTQIEYRSTSEQNTDLFGVYIDKGLDNSETITYLQNNKIKAKVNFLTYNYDEMGVKYNLAKYYGKSIYDFNYKSYDEITNNNANTIRYANTGEPVQFSYFGKSIVGTPSKEDITTKFIVNGKEELEKAEVISYGLSDKYRKTMGFEVLQGYAIINERVTRSLIENWMSKSSAYLDKMGIMNVYGMFMASLETAWLADEIADQYAKELNVKWSREKTVTVLGGINLDDTYLHILNADMGMGVSGDSENAKVFRLMNSVYLPDIENYVLEPIANRYLDNATSSLDSLMLSVENNEFSIVQLGEIFYILSENKNTTMIINSTTGVANTILIDEGFAYKGAKIPTANDCCSVSASPNDLLKGLKDTMEKFKKAGSDLLNDVLNKLHPLSSLAYKIASLGMTIAGKLIPGASTGLASTVGLMLQIHSIGNDAKNNFLGEESWHWAYEHVTFTRDSPIENKKFFNIPKSDGTYDYIEVEINPDGSLNRNNALYVGNGYTKKLTKSETYNYFTEEKWTSCDIPRKYQKNEVPLIFG